MSPLRLQNNTLFGRARVITIRIEESPDPSRIREHKIFPIPGTDVFTLLQKERGRITNWTGSDVTFALGEEDMSLTLPAKTIRANLLAITRRDLKDVRLKRGSLDGVSYEALTVKKEKR